MDQSLPSWVQGGSSPALELSVWPLPNSSVASPRHPSAVGNDPPKVRAKLVYLVTNQSLLGLVLFVALPDPDLLHLLHLALRYLLPSLANAIYIH